MIKVPGNEKTGKRNGDLVPAPTADRPLTPAQEAFRALIARVESLRHSIDTGEAELDATLAYYSAELIPRIERQTAARKELVRALAPYANKSFFRRQQERVGFKDFIQELLHEIAKVEKGLVDDDLKEIYNVVHGSGYGKHERKTIAAMKAALAEMFAEAGMEADFSELECVVSEAEFMSKAEAMMARMRKLKEAEAEAAHCAEHGHHSTEDSEERAAEEFRKRSIAKLYKQLARVLHPDLEQDRGRQSEKVQLMQELTEAYRQSDLHTLLRLELQWIENESGNVERLSEEKLGVYNEVLSDQAKALEKRLRELLYHPRFRPIVYFDNGLTLAIKGPDKARELDESVSAIESAIARLETVKTSEDVLAAIDPLLPAKLAS